MSKPEGKGWRNQVWFAGFPGTRKTSPLGALAGTFCLALLTGFPVGAQKLNIQTYGNDRGLIQQQVLSIHQDASGYLWMGTFGGLSRYDGSGFQNYTTRNGLSANSVSALAEDSAGRLIVGTQGGGVCLMDGPDFSCLGPSSGLPMEEVRDLVTDPLGGFWVATVGGLARVAGGTVRTYSEADGLPSSRVEALAWDDSGQLWVGTDAGLARFEDEGFFPQSPEVLAEHAIQLIEPTPWGLLVGSTEELFLQGQDGLRKLELPADLSRPVFQDAAVDASGTVWIATNQRGALRYDGQSLERVTRENGLPTNELYSILVDSEGTVWFGTGDGASKMVPGPIESYSWEQGLPNPLVRAITEDGQGRLWMGTREGAAIWVDGQFQTIVGASELPEPRVYALAPTRDGGMLIGTVAGLVHWNGQVRRVYGLSDGLPDEYVRSLLPDPEGGVWVGTASGLAFWEEGRITSFPDDPILSDAHISDMHFDRRGRLWVPMRSGGVAIRDSTGVTLAGPGDQLSTEGIWSIDMDQAGSMWIATNGDGVYRVNEDGSTGLHLTSEEGLASDLVWSVLSDSQGSVWLFTSRGLDRVTRDGIRHYRKSDGLPDLEGNTAAAWEASDGTLWFGTGISLARYHPDREGGNPLPPPVLVQQVATSGGLVADGQRLPNGFGNLTVDYTALSFRNEAEVRFQYRLIGASEEWSEPTADRRISYGGLPPGSYEFQVRGSNDAGVWNPAAASFLFSVSPAFWQSWWFRLLVGVLLLGAVIAAVSLRTRHLERERRRLESLVGARTHDLEERTLSLEEEISERERLEDELLEARKLEAVGRLAGGVAHDFNNIMTTILTANEFIAEELGEGHRLHPEVAEIEKAAHQAATLTRQLSAVGRKQVFRPELLDLNEVSRETLAVLKPLLGEDVTVTLDPANGLWGIRADREQLERVLTNLAVNAREAMPDGGVFTLSTANQETGATEGRDPEGVGGPWVQLTVQDTGAGIEASVLPQIFEPFFSTKDKGEHAGLGLATVYGIVKQSGGEIHAESTVGEGTLFEIFFPRAEQFKTKTQKTPAPPPRSVGKGITVLVAEDEAPVRRAICRALKLHGFDVLEADNGRIALDIAAAHSGGIDLLVTDIIMPELSGSELAEELVEARPGTRVLFISGYVADELGDHGVLAEGTEFLGKPFLVAELIERVSGMLEEK